MGQFLLLDLAVGGIDLGLGYVISLRLLAVPLGLLLVALVGRGGRFDQPVNLRNVNRFYHTLLIGRSPLEL